MPFLCVKSWWDRWRKQVKQNRCSRWVHSSTDSQEQEAAKYEQWCLVRWTRQRYHGQGCCFSKSYLSTEPLYNVRFTSSCTLPFCWRMKNLKKVSDLELSTITLHKNTRRALLDQAKSQSGPASCICQWPTRQHTRHLHPGTLPCIWHPILYW